MSMIGTCYAPILIGIMLKNYSEGGPLPDEVVSLLDGAWEKGRGVAAYYAI